MPLTKKQKDNLKKIIKEKIGVDVYRISLWDSLYQTEHPEEENYSLYCKGKSRGAWLHLKKETANNNFVLNFTAASCVIFSDFFHLINKGIYARLDEIINIVNYKNLIVLQQFETLDLASGDLDNLDESVDIKWSFVLKYLHIPSDYFLDFSTYVTESENKVIVRAMNENMTVLRADDELDIKTRDVAIFDDKENALRYLMLSFIECIHYLSKHSVMIEHHPYEDFEKNNTLADLIEHYKKQRLVDDMRGI